MVNIDLGIINSKLVKENNNLVAANVMLNAKASSYAVHVRRLNKRLQLIAAGEVNTLVPVDSIDEEPQCNRCMKLKSECDYCSKCNANNNYIEYCRLLPVGRLVK